MTPPARRESEQHRGGPEAHCAVRVTDVGKRKHEADHGESQLNEEARGATGVRKLVKHGAEMIRCIHEGPPQPRHSALTFMSTPPDDAATDGDEIVVMPIEDSIDLHAFQPRDVLAVVADYLEEAAKRGFDEVRLIHGRGKGVQRANVQAMLATHPLVMSFRDAPAARGGWGATLVELRIPH